MPNANTPTPDSVAHRFFVDHGVVHDRKTGRHVCGCGCIALESSADDLLALLQSLENEAASWRLTARAFAAPTPGVPVERVRDYIEHLRADKDRKYADPANAAVQQIRQVIADELEALTGAQA